MISRFCALLTLGLATVVPSMFATTYTGSDTSCFGAFSCSSMSSGVTSDGVVNKDLQFTPTTFSQTGNGTVDLGTFSLGTNFSIIGGVFNLDVTFAQPAGVSGSGNFDAVLAGLVAFNNGFAYISFDQPTTQSFTYPGGSFSLSLNDSVISLCANHSADLMATITNTSPAPEPTSMLLLGSGLGLLGLARFRRTAKQ